MTGQNIIDLFDVLTDGLSELTAAQKLELADRKYKEVINLRNWQELLTEASLTFSSNSVTIPADFKAFAENEFGNVDAPYKWVFYEGDTPHPIVRMNERHRFSTFPYWNRSAGTIIAPDSYNGKAITLPYYQKADALTLNTSPVFENTDCHKVVAYLMAVEHYSIDQTEGGRSKADDYKTTADNIIADMEYDDAVSADATQDYA